VTKSPSDVLVLGTIKTDRDISPPITPGAMATSVKGRAVDTRSETMVIGTRMSVRVRKR
jgi:hypothetical protein